MNKMGKIKLTFVGLRPAMRAMVNRNLALDKRVVKSEAKAMKSLKNKIKALAKAKASMKRALTEKNARTKDKVESTVFYIKNRVVSNMRQLFLTIVEGTKKGLRGYELQELREQGIEFSVVENRLATIGEFFFDLNKHSLFRA